MLEKYLLTITLYQNKYKDDIRKYTVLQKTIDILSPTQSPDMEKNITLQMTTLCENAPAKKFQYNYAENIGDGRGITFGIIGFTTGTFDGNMLLKYYTKLQPQNTLKKYITALDILDKEKHDAEGKLSNTQGLDGFIEAIETNKDPLFKQAQLDLLVSLYWKPALNLSDEMGVKYPLSRAFIYDMTVNHGEE